MTGPSLRTFLADIDDDPREGVLEVTRAVDRDLEMCAVVKRLEELGNPVTRFSNVSGSEVPAIFGLTATRERIARALGQPVQGCVEWFARRVRAPLAYEVVAGAPVQDVVRTGEDASLDRLPIGVHSPDDAARYLTSGVLVLRDPTTGNLNTGIYRMMVLGPRQFTVCAAPAHDASKIIDAVAAESGSCDFAVVIGGHPTFAIGSQAKNPTSVDSYELVGALQGEPLEVVRAATVNLPVPAEAELVIEGTIRTRERQKEGPFGEFTYYYGQYRGWVADVSAITRRRDACYVDIHPAHVEHRCLWLFPGREARLLELLRQAVPSVHRVHLPLPGGSMTAVVALRNPQPGDARRVLTLALSSDAYIKHAVVVDDDIDVLDLDQVHWALAVRFQADRDTIVIPNCAGVSTDPSAYSITDPGASGPYTTKLGLDATIPVGRAFPARADVVPDAFQHIDISDYLPADLPGSMATASRRR